MLTHLLPPALLSSLIDRAFEEDLAGGDLTTEATIAPNLIAGARAIAKSELVACGGEVFRQVFTRFDASLEVELDVPDGQLVSAGAVLWRVRGSARSILMAERTALNFVQRMCGTATLTHRYVSELPSGARTRVVDTRKTTPGLRALERYAVRCGGAHNHRDNLGSAVLIKDNHIEAAGSIRAAVEGAKARAPHTAKIEVEVEDLAGVEEALEAHADIIMLDNFAPEALRAAIDLVGGRALIEVSGGVGLSRVAELARLGVDIISVGALTHSAPASDISLMIQKL